MKNLVIIGGDKRMEYLAEYLNNNGFDVKKYGLSDSITKAELAEVLALKEITVILPLPMSRDGENINMSKAQESVSYSFLSERLKSGDVIFGGMIKEQFKDMFKDKNIVITDYYDEDFILKNAYLTAECMPQVIFKNTGLSVKNMKIALTGYGRTSKAIAAFLKPMGAKVLVSARSVEALEDAAKSGYSICALADLQCIAAGFDIIINTVPSLVINENIIKVLTKKTSLIDIASPPFGVDFESAEKHGIKAVKALSLPGRYVPREAGYIIGEKLKLLL